MLINRKSLRNPQSANDEVYRVIEVYPDNVDMGPGSHTAIVTVHSGQTRVVIYLTSEEVVELGDYSNKRAEPFPEWFRYRVTRAVIDTALRGF